MTIGGFILGIAIAILGFFMVWKGHRWREYVGDLREIMQFSGMGWLDWPVLGAFLMFVGVMMAFGIFQAIAVAILGPLFSPKIN